MKHEETAKRLALALSRSGLNQQQLADKSGVSKHSISQYINGHHAPSNINAAKIGEILNVNPMWLMGYDVEANTLINSETRDDSEFLRGYYVNPETSQIAQKIFDNPDLRILFDAARDAKPENLQLAAEMLRRFKETNPDG